MKEKPKILITGADGFVGKNLLQALLRSDEYFLYAHTRNPINLNLVVNIVGDLRDIRILDHYLPGIDCVIHLAAKVSYNKKDQKEIYRDNVILTRDLVNQCLIHNVPRIIYISSASTLTRSSDPFLITEKSSGRPIFHSFYAKSKYLGELEIKRGEAEGMQVQILNPCLMLGKGDWTKGSLQLIKRIGEGLRYFPSGNLGIVDVQILIEAIQICLKKDSSSGPHLLWQASFSYKDFINKVCEIMNIESPKIEIGPKMAAWYSRFKEWRSFILKKHNLISTETAFLSSHSFQFVVHNPLPGLTKKRLDLDEVIKKSIHHNI
ncbi:MAG: NAD-dependent epimerase/dehydratase family protein [Saprospiraceae bacterium]|nr:NAD-dependent epimerase/dehydratase family protein [Saprospiraceae bacterium]